MPYKPIEDYGLVGDLHSAALVGIDGSIDFMCFPNFDSPSIFAAMLDDARGGCFALRPVNPDHSRKQIYLTDSNILLTRFLYEDGLAEISDFMPLGMDRHAHDLVRRAKTIRGEISYRMVCKPRFDYGRASHEVRQRDGEILFIPRRKGLPALRLATSVPTTTEDGAAIAEFTLGADTSASFVLEEAREGRQSPTARENYVASSFKETLNFWRGWIGRSQYRGRWREIVNRSALVLKLLTYQPTGSIVAAPTFGLPEVVGKARNWDYRYTWIRDASFTLGALIRLGYTEEAGAFMRWIEDRCNELQPDGSLQIMYGIDGRHELTEEVLPDLEGYRKSSPVRVGNAAHRQLQLDIYGELMDAIYLYDSHGEPISHGLWQNVVRLLDWVCEHWREKDDGIWEVRGGRQEFLLSRVMCWVALERGIRLANRRSFPAPLERWLTCRDKIYRSVFEEFWDPQRNTFTQYRAASTVDASNLLMPLVGFISPVDPRWLSTLRAIEESLVYDSLVYRYRVGQGAFDGLVGEEGTFNMCTFWFAECLSRAGDAEKARFYFEKMLGYASHLGLYSEELGRKAEHLGNFPQAFTHLGLISAACEIDGALNALGQNW